MKDVSIKQPKWKGNGNIRRCTRRTSTTRRFWRRETTTRWVEASDSFFCQRITGPTVQKYCYASDVSCAETIMMHLWRSNSGHCNSIYSHISGGRSWSIRARSDVAGKTGHRGKSQGNRALYWNGTVDSWYWVVTIASGCPISGYFRVYVAIHLLFRWLSSWTTIPSWSMLCSPVSHSSSFCTERNKNTVVSIGRLQYPLSHMIYSGFSLNAFVVWIGLALS